MNERYGERRDTPIEEPAPVITEMARTATWAEIEHTHTRRWRNGTQQNACEREMTEPAPTIHFGHNMNRVEWVYSDGRSEDFQRGPVAVDQPAPTLSSTARQSEWVHGRPATTVAGDPRIAKPGHKGTVKTDPHAIPQMEGAVRVTVPEASTLQSFPPDFPWRGSRTAQFRQIGNAVPPLLARAILAALLESERR